MVARKRIKPWSLMEHMMGVKFIDLSRLYNETSNAPGLIHAVAGGPVLDGDRYDVTLAPLGRQGNTRASTMRRPCSAWRMACCMDWLQFTRCVRLCVCSCVSFTVQASDLSVRRAFYLYQLHAIEGGSNCAVSPSRSVANGVSLFSLIVHLLVHQP